jgi:hypothetical protein
MTNYRTVARAKRVKTNIGETVSDVWYDVGALVKNTSERVGQARVDRQVGKLRSFCVKLAQEAPKHGIDLRLDTMECVDDDDLSNRFLVEQTNGTFHISQTRVKAIGERIVTTQYAALESPGATPGLRISQRTTDLDDVFVGYACYPPLSSTDISYGQAADMVRQFLGDFKAAV